MWLNFKLEPMATALWFIDWRENFEQQILSKKNF